MIEISALLFNYSMKIYGHYNSPLSGKRDGLWYKAVGSHPSSSLLTHFRVNVFAMECISHKKNGLLKYFRVNEILLLIEDMRTV